MNLKHPTVCKFLAKKGKSLCPTVSEGKLCFSGSAESFQVWSCGSSKCKSLTFHGKLLALIVFLQLRGITWPCNAKQSTYQSWQAGRRKSGVCVRFVNGLRHSQLSGWSLFSNKDAGLIYNDMLLCQELGVISLDLYPSARMF